MKNLPISCICKICQRECSTTKNMLALYILICEFPACHDYINVSLAFFVHKNWVKYVKECFTITSFTTVFFNIVCKEKAIKLNSGKKWTSHRKRKFSIISKKNYVSNKLLY